MVPTQQSSAFEDSTDRRPEMTSRTFPQVRGAHDHKLLAVRYVPPSLESEQRSRQSFRS